MPKLPEGFAPHFRKSAVTDPWEPLYSRQNGGILELGLELRAAHCNSRGLMHGGVIASLADNAMGLSYVLTYAENNETPKGGAVTVSLNIDYLAAGKLGQWVQVTPRVIRAGKNMGFVDALVTADGTPIARANATFRVQA
ncbi:MAG: hotdog fold thioesterase [Rhizobiales bacterium]|nr:hotdog fold thioesterase [Hyphomicrobiales bacterium]